MHSNIILPVGVDQSHDGSTSPGESPPELTSEVIEVVGDHPVGHVVTDLAAWLRDGVDLLSLTTYLWMLLGVHKSGLQLWVVADDLTKTQQAISRVLTLCPDRATVLGYQPQLSRIVEARQQADTVVIATAASHKVADRLLEDTATRFDGEGSTSIVISTTGPSRSVAGPRLALASPPGKHAFAARHASHQFGRPVINISPEGLLITKLLHQARGDQPLLRLGRLDDLRIKPTGNHWLVLNALISAAVWLRCTTDGDADWAVADGDYGFVRRLLNSSSVLTEDVRLTPKEASFAEHVYAYASKKSQQRTRRRMTPSGEAFSIREIAEATNISWNTVAKYLKKLESERLLESRPERNLKTKRKHQVYRFTDDAVPPFKAQNPFRRLPKELPPDA
ncbi:hypothetical protein MalM25_08400 [Planctomycetes bacterium MalM25]|nr:hypothetical protein MalM25_08400 [Planctomycetes bacterium MalM25]